MTKKKVFVLVVALAVAAAAGYGLGAVRTGAAEPAKQPPMMMQPGQMDPKAMADMMNTPQMQQQCVAMMKSPEMQQAMMTMMRQPEMQAAMKQMLQKDAGFHQMMLDLVNSVDMNMDHGPKGAPVPGGGPSGHDTHHQ